MLFIEQRCSIILINLCLLLNFILFFCLNFRKIYSVAVEYFLNISILSSREITFVFMALLSFSQIYLSTFQTSLVDLLWNWKKWQFWPNFFAHLQGFRSENGIICWPLTFVVSGHCVSRSRDKSFFHLFQHMDPCRVLWHENAILQQYRNLFRVKRDS